VFPVGPQNGESLEKHFCPDVNRRDLVDHPAHHIYLKLAIDGKTSKPFSAYTLPPFCGVQPQGSTANTLRKPATTEEPGSKGPDDFRPGQRALL
jgi:hypothetical protein